MEARAEFIIPREKLNAVRGSNRKLLLKVEKLYSCNVELSDVGDPIGEWVTICGREADVSLAKVYIISLCDPEEETCVPYPEEMHEMLNGDLLQEIEHTSSAVVLLKDGEAVIRGSSFAVTVAVSILESRITASQEMGTASSDLASPGLEGTGHGFNLDEELARALKRHNSEMEADDLSSIRSDVKFMMVEQLSSMQGATVGNFESEDDSALVDHLEAGSTDATVPDKSLTDQLPPRSTGTDVLPSPDTNQPIDTRVTKAKPAKSPAKPKIACNFVKPPTSKGFPLPQAAAKATASSASSPASQPNSMAGASLPAMSPACTSAARKSLWNAPTRMSMSAFSGVSAQSSHESVSFSSSITSSSDPTPLSTSHSDSMSAAIAALSTVTMSNAPMSTVTSVAGRCSTATTGSHAMHQQYPPHSASASQYAGLPSANYASHSSSAGTSGQGSTSHLGLTSSSKNHPRKTAHSHASGHTTPSSAYQPDALPPTHPNYSSRRTSNQGNSYHQHHPGSTGAQRHGHAATSSAATRGKHSTSGQHGKQRQAATFVREVSKPPGNLRPIVIDSSNIAMSHGNGKIFSCRGIKIVVDYFEQRGHTEITAFVPNFRQGQSRPDQPATDQYLLQDLIARQRVSITPSRMVHGRLVVSYDDRFILRYARLQGGVVVSNDQYRDLYLEEPTWRPVIDNHLLPYAFVGDVFMPPDDPLGRKGPNLDQFLRF